MVSKDRITNEDPSFISHVNEPTRANFKRKAAYQETFDRYQPA